MGLIIATLLVLLVIVSALAQDFSVFSWAYWQEGDASTSRSEVFRNVGLFFVAAIALGFGIWRAWTAHRQAEASQRQAEAANEQARIAQEGQITDRFSTAVEHLGSAQLPVRLGGVYALWRLIEDSPERDVISVIDILCAFVRHPPHEIGQDPDTGASEDGRASAEKAEEAGSAAEIRPDVQTVLNLIGNENADYRALLPAGYFLDLSGANLTGANLGDANLAHANLMHADLSDGNLTGAHLSNSNLLYADLSNANLMDADLTDAFLMYANLTNAYLDNANLKDADLRNADLTGAGLGNANLTGANFTNAKNLTPAQLYGIHYDRDAPPKLPPGLVLPEPPPEPGAEDAAPTPPET